MEDHVRIFVCLTDKSILNVMNSYYGPYFFLLSSLSRFVFSISYIYRALCLFCFFDTMMIIAVIVNPLLFAIYLQTNQNNPKS